MSRLRLIRLAVSDRWRSGPKTCCTANSETAGETPAVAACRLHGRSVTCRDFWRFRGRFPTDARDRPLAIVRLSQRVSVPLLQMPFGNSRPRACGSWLFAKKTLEQAGRATDGKTSRRRRSPHGVTKRCGRIAELGPRANDRQAAAGMFFRPADWVFDREWPRAAGDSANLRGASR
jgi:hypothetical protein